MRATPSRSKQVEPVQEFLERSDQQTTAGQLALEMMHEIRNPLEALCQLAYLTKAEAENPAQVRMYMGLVDEQIDTLRHVISTSLGFAKSYGQPKSTDLVGLANAALRIHQRRIDVNQIHLVRKLPPDLVTALHAGEMLQVLSNLIVNALDALPADGTLHVRLRRCDSCLYILIADNGHGIPEQHLDAVWRPFFTTKGECGTGLGLALSKRIVERHHGTIAVRSSVRQGKSGTVFRITIPTSLFADMDQPQHIAAGT